MSIKKQLLIIISFYQKISVLRNAFIRSVFISSTDNPNSFNNTCRYSPTCSQYTYQAIERYGIFKGLLLGIKRVLRCHPWSEGGKDPLPSRF
jgi:putative membrane protein insertion efficiency factor